MVLFNNIRPNLDVCIDNLRLAYLCKIYTYCQYFAEYYPEYKTLIKEIKKDLLKINFNELEKYNKDELEIFSDRLNIIIEEIEKTDYYRMDDFKIFDRQYFLDSHSLKFLRYIKLNKL